MKELLVLRHAKSSWEAPGLDDHDRPLNDRGKRDAPRMGQHIASEAIMPELVLTSDAKRAAKTAKLVCEGAGYKGSIVVRKEFYLAEASGYIAVLKTLPDSVHRVMVIGHNPGMEVLVASLTRHREEMPTCALAHILFSITSWGELQLSTPGLLQHVWRPRDFANPS